MENPNCTAVEASTKSDSDRYNNLNGKVNNNTTNFAAFKSFLLDELHEIKEKVYNLGLQNPEESGLFDNLKVEIKFWREAIYSKSLDGMYVISTLLENELDSSTQMYY